MSVIDRKRNILLAKLARESFLSYAVMVSPKYEVAGVHKIFGEMVHRIKDTLLTEKGNLNLIVTVPPRHGKTHTFVELMGTWLAGLLPGLEIIYATHTKTFAEQTGSKMRKIFRSKRYRAIMYDAHLGKDTKSKSHIELVNNSSFKGTGVGGNITGFGGNILIADDLIKSREEAESKTKRDRAFTFLRDTLSSRIQPYRYNKKVLGKVKIVIMQRWHTDDIVGRLLEEQAKNELENPNGNFEKWEIINFEAIATEDQYINGELFRKAGEPLWPEVFGIKELEEIRARSLYAWASQYQQDPVMSELQVFKEEMFKYYNINSPEFKKKKLDYYTFVDPAISMEENADNSVVLTIAKERDGYNIYRIREDAGHFKPAEVIDLIIEHFLTYNSRVTIEQIAFQKSLRYALEEELRRRNIYMRIYETKKGNKEQRIGVGLLTLYQQGVIYHRDGVLDKEYEMELLQFPRGKHDDRADAMSFLLDAIKQTRREKIQRQVRFKVRSYMRR